MPGVSAGSISRPIATEPSSCSMPTLAVSRSIDRDRLHGFFAPLTR